MKAAFLIRCSTKNQDLSRQTRDLTRLAQSMGYEYDLENLVFGEKITGKDDVTKKNRDSIDRLLKAAKEQLFDIVLVAEVSRMSRDPASGRVYVRLLINMGIPVYFKDIDTWTIDPETGKKVRDAETVIGGAFDAAWKYLKSMKTQIASARRNQLDNGAISVGKPYFGYKWHGGRDKTIKTRWIVDELAAEVVSAVFNEYLKDGATLKSTALAITAKYGELLNRRFTVSTVEQILNYDTYHTGVKKINLTDPDSEDVEVFSVDVPKLISIELYKAAEAKRKANRVKSEPYPSQSVHILSKLIKCPCCGYTMTPKAKNSSKASDGAYRMINGKKALSWICMSGINNATICPNRMSLANEKAEPIIWELVKRELIGLADVNEKERLLKVEELQRTVDYLNTTILNYQMEIEKLQKRLKVAYEFSVSSATMAGDDEELKVLAMEQFNKTAKEIREEQKKIENSIEQAKAEIATLSNQITFYSQPTLPIDIIERAEANPDEQRNLVKELITKIIPYKITTFKKKRREKGKEASKPYNDTDIITVKNGAVLLAVYTVNGIYYIFYNANDRESVRYAYYMQGVYYQNSVEPLKAFGTGEFFVIPNATMVMETTEIEEVVSINEFVEIAKNNNYILEYRYKPEA